ncbi:MAG TPA: iron-containing redox enzyme family protein [Acidimicrobiia bacterium]|nr:iron-containing redox enzyme family protein [Acidimicrobiia bacterium]
MSVSLLRALRDPCEEHLAALDRVAFADDALDGEDQPLALYCAYELRYRGFAGVSDELEWHPALLALTARLEGAFLSRLRAGVDERFGRAPTEPRAVFDALRRLASSDGPSVSAFMAERGTLDQMREFAVHRAPYQLKEADPHTWVIPRLSGTAKAAVIEIQADEYGNGRRTSMHAELFADTMRALGLDARYGALLDLVPGATLSTVNLVSYFGLHRRWRGALVGHLALFEMCSVVPMGRYVAALERLRVPEGAPFYTAHVEADEWHQHVALERMAGGLIHDEPELAADVAFGARAVALLEDDLARRLLGAWAEGRTSLRAPLAASLRLAS